MKKTCLKSLTGVSDSSGFTVTVPHLRMLIKGELLWLACKTFLFNTRFYICKEFWVHMHSEFPPGISSAYFAKRQSLSRVLFVTPRTVCSLPGSSVHGILRVRILEWVVMPFSRESSWSRDWTWVSRIAGRFLLSEPLGNFDLTKLSTKNTAVSGWRPLP